MKARWLAGGLRAGRTMLTWKRLFHGLRVAGSYVWARYRLGWNPPPYPLFLGVEPTTACNLRCPHCISGLRAFSRPTGTLDPALLEKVLAELHPYLWGVLFYFQGEPTLHPHLGRLIRTATQYRLLTSLSTNAHLLTEEKCTEMLLAGLTHIRISIDGMTQESYARYRVGGSLAVVQEGVRRLLALRKAYRSPFPLVELQLIAFRHNYEEVAAFRAWSREVGADAAHVKTAQLLNPTPEAFQAWIPPQASRYEKAPNSEIRLKGRIPNRCWRLWRAAEITWDGQLLPCCFDKNAEYAFGSLQENNFQSLWHSPKAERFRKAVFRRRQSVDICRNCSEGIQTWL